LLITLGEEYIQMITADCSICKFGYLHTVSCCL